MSGRAFRPGVRPHLRPSLFEPTKPFWLISLFQNAVIVIVAYFIAVFAYLVVHQIVSLPKGDLWDESFRLPLEFILILIVSGILMVPYFQKEWDRSLRMFSLFTTFFLCSFAALASTHVFDPRVPLQLISSYAIEPLRHLLRF